MPKWSILASFWKLKACDQTVLPDRSILIGQKLVENTIVEEVKWNILSNFQTMWIRLGDDDDTHLLLKWNAKMNVVCILWELRDEFLQHSCHPIFMMCCSVGFFWLTLSRTRVLDSEESKGRETTVVSICTCCQLGCPWLQIFATLHKKMACVTTKWPEP